MLIFLYKHFYSKDVHLKHLNTAYTLSEILNYVIIFVA